MTLSNRKKAFVVLTILGILITLYFIILKEWVLAVIGILFSFVASYNMTCKEK